MTKAGRLKRVSKTAPEIETLLREVPILAEKPKYVSRIDFVNFNGYTVIPEQLTVSNVIAIAKKLNLEDYLSYFLLHNKASKQPYHNTYHTLNVVNNLFQILQCDLPDLTNKATLRALFLAALFHDFNHTGGIASDESNIIITVRGLRSAQLRSAQRERELTIDSFSRIEELIRCTEYPYKEVQDLIELGDDGLREEYLSYAYMLRDADMSQICTDNFLQQNVIGLGTELGYSLVDMLENQIKFLGSVKFHSVYAKRAYIPKVIEKLEELHQLKSIIYV